MISALDILKASILIVDDQQANICLLDQMLRGAGYLCVTSTRNPQEVCELYRKNRYSLIVLDLLMPDMDGFEVMEGLKAIETQGYLPVLVITAQPAHKLRALKAGAKDFVSKPFDLAEVLVRVHNMLEVRLLHLETKRLYDQEQKASEQLLLIFRSGTVAVSINTVADGRIIDANEECCRFFGYAREEILGGSVTDLNLWANPEDRAPVMQRLIRERAMRGFECQQRLRSGEVRDVLVSLELIKLAGESELVLISMFIDITDRKQAEEQLKETHKQLLIFAREAGMAEVATGVLHNVGNVLNSVNVSATLVTNNVKNSKAPYLDKVVALLNEHTADIGAFMANDPKGRQLPAYLGQLAGQLAREQQTALAELESLRKNIEHVKDIVAMQQSYAKVSGVTATHNVVDLVEDALRMNAAALGRHEVKVAREYAQVPPVMIDKHKVLQVLVNLIRNAKYACDDSQQKDKQLKLQISKVEAGIRIAVIDNGVGIPVENLARIFNNGFTTKKDGHGFGLHSGILAAKEMGGALTVQSEGNGKGATFTLILPMQPPKTPSKS